MTVARPLAGTVRLKRIYDAPTPADGYRVLVDRLWPRGLSKGAADVDLWLKEAAPSTELRRWYHADLTRWPEFRKRYKAELAAPDNAALKELRAIVREHAKRGGKGVTLLYGARDTEQNHAIVLREALLGRTARRSA